MSLEETSGKPPDTSRMPTVSVILPTLNSARTLAECLAAIRAQQYPRECLEIVVADGGSTDDTLAIARRFEVDRIVENPLRTGEAGKAAAIAASTGELLALIDSDNVLTSPDWLSRMVAPFADTGVFASEPISYERRASDPALTRYFALLGMNDPLCLFVGNYDRYCAVTGRWTGLDIAVEDRCDYLLARLSPEAVPTVGANGCLIRRAVLGDLAWTPYYFDIDIIQQAVSAGHSGFAKVKCGIVHLYAGRLRDFARKQDRRIRDFLHFSGERQRSYPWKRRGTTGGVLRFCATTVTVLPLLVQMARGARRVPDRAWLCHLPVCWITLWCYGRAVLLGAIAGRRGVASRDHWKG